MSLLSGLWETWPLLGDQALGLGGTPPRARVSESEGCKGTRPAETLAGRGSISSWLPSSPAPPSRFQLFFCFPGAAATEHGVKSRREDKLTDSPGGAGSQGGGVIRLRGATSSEISVLRPLTGRATWRQCRATWRASRRAASRPKSCPGEREREREEDRELTLSCLPSSCCAGGFVCAGPRLPGDCK